MVKSKAIPTKEKFDIYDSWAELIGLMSEQAMKKPVAKARPKKRLTQLQLDDYYAKDSIAAKICDRPAEDMLKMGIDINHKKADKIYELHTKWDISALLEEAIKYDGFYGGSVMFFDVDDGLEDHSEPLDFKKIKGINDIVVLDRFCLTPKDYTSYLKKPTIYTLAQGSIDIHVSRLAFFTGLDSGIRNRFYNQGFGESRVFRCLTELNNYAGGHDALPEILSNFLTNIFKFKNFTKMILDGKADKIRKKAGYLQANKNLMNALVIDDEDDFISNSINVSGLDKLIEMIERRLCAAAGMPHTRLLEESPGGGLTNNGGQSEQSEQWNDWIKTQQVKKLTKPLELIHSIFAAILKLGVNNPIKYEFNPLRQQTQSQIIEDRSKQADIDKKLVELGIPEEMIIEKRLGSGYYSHETTFTPEEITMIKSNIQESKTKALENQKQINNFNSSSKTNE